MAGRACRIGRLKMAGISTNTIRKITIQASADGVEDATGKINGLTDAQTRLAAGSASVASVTDAVTKRQLSAEEAYRRQTLSVDSNAAAQARLTSAVKTLDAAMAQGVIKSSDEYYQRL